MRSVWWIFFVAILQVVLAVSLYPNDLDRQAKSLVLGGCESNTYHERNARAGNNLDNSEKVAVYCFPCSSSFQLTCALQSKQIVGCLSLTSDFRGMALVYSETNAIQFKKESSDWFYELWNTKMLTMISISYYTISTKHLLRCGELTLNFMVARVASTTED